MNIWITQVTSEQADNHPGKWRTSKMSQISQMSVYLLLRTHQKLEQKPLKCTQLKYTGRSSFIPAKYTSNPNLMQKTHICMYMFAAFFLPRADCLYSQDQMHIFWEYLRALWNGPKSIQTLSKFGAPIKIVLFI